MLALPRGDEKCTWQTHGKTINLFIEGEAEGRRMGRGEGHSSSWPHAPRLPFLSAPASPGEPRSFGTERSEFRDEAGDLQEPERRQNQRAAGFMGLKVRQGWRLREAQGEGSKVNLSV